MKRCSIINSHVLYADESVMKTGFKVEYVAAPHIPGSFLPFLASNQRENRKPKKRSGGMLCVWNVIWVPLRQVDWNFIGAPHVT